MATGPMTLRPIGAIRSPVHLSPEMPQHGVSGTVEIFEEYAPALDGICDYSHLFLICWMHRGERSLLRAVPRKISPGLPEKGVFSLRSPSRPNPISITVVRLLQVREGRFLEVADMDMIDGTPLLDIKPYQPGLDCVFSARRADRSERILHMDPIRYRQELMRLAVNFHGESCCGVATAVRMAEAASRMLGGDLRREDIILVTGTDPCISDALIGITGARPGNGRLQTRKGHAGHYQLSRGDCTVEFHVPPMQGDCGQILRCDENELFTCTLSGTPRIR